MQSIVVVGAPTEIEQISSIFTSEHIINVLPEMSIGRLFAVIEDADVVLANDSAALHIAVGFKRPLIALFGPTNPSAVGPYKQYETVIAAAVDYGSTHYRDKKIGDSIMRLIQVDDVIEALHALLEKQEG
jgi:ADP-heptose:LPS heptosyltransferase